MAKPVRVMVERGKKKRVVAVAFDWPGWDRSGKTEDEALEVLESYRGRFAPVADLAGLSAEFAGAAGFDVVERVRGIGMTDYYGLSGVPAGPEHDAMSAEECERKIAILSATWAYCDGVYARVSPQLGKGPRGGGRERDEIYRHVNGWEIYDLAKKVGLEWPVETREDRAALAAYREAFVDAIRERCTRGETMARTWTLQFLIRRCAWHQLDHAWEMEDRDLSDVS